MASGPESPKDEIKKILEGGKSEKTGLKSQKLDFKVHSSNCRDSRYEINIWLEAWWMSETFHI